MAISDLQLEAKHLQEMFVRANKNKPGGLRYELARESQQHTIDAKELARQLHMHTEDPYEGKRYFGKKDTKEFASHVGESKDFTTGTVNGKTINFNSDGVIKNANSMTPQYKAWIEKYGEDYKIQPFSEFKKLLESFCSDYVVAVKKAVAARNDMSVQRGSSEKFIFVVSAVTEREDVYGKLQAFTGGIANKVAEQDEYRTMFANSKSQVSGLINVGHTIAVAEEKAGVFSAAVKGGKTIVRSDKLDAFDEKLDKALEDLKLEIDLDQVRNVDWRSKTLSDKRMVKTDAESSFFNQARAGAPEKAGIKGGISETSIGKKIENLLKEYKKILKEEYEKAPEHLKGSQTMLQAAQAMILYTATEKVNKKTLKITSKLTKPKTGKKKNNVQAPSVTFKRGHKKMRPNTVGLGNAKPGMKKIPNPPRMKSESGTSLAPLIALLNSKLPETVARNMGPPGLENQTGRFASSVRVTDVSRTAQGFPSVGYDYRRNPYQVFEMGSGQPPWATPDRDPRKVIDQSIREIAAQFAIGRFYTRRI